MSKILGMSKNFVPPLYTRNALYVKSLREPGGGGGGEGAHVITVAGN